MQSLSEMRLNTPWAIIIGTIFISGAILFSAEAVPVLQLIATLSLVVLAFFARRTTRRIEWFTGAMQRHSDQQRQIAAKQAGLKLIWWDPNESSGHFPEGGQHGEEFKLEEITVGLPPHQRKKKPNRWQKFWGAR